MTSRPLALGLVGALKVAGTVRACDGVRLDNPSGYTAIYICMKVRMQKSLPHIAVAF